MRGAPIGLVPLVHVRDHAASLEFYARLAFVVESARPGWASLRSGGARLMISQATAPVVAGQQAVLFYIYSNDLAGFREELAEAGVEVGEITHPDHMRGGEMRLTDPDGYVLLVGQREIPHRR